MWATSLTIVLLFPLLSAAPLDTAGVDDNDGLHSHDENVTRQGKHFSHNKFDLSVSVTGNVDSIGHKVNIDVHPHTDDHHHHENDTVIECKEELRVLFQSIDSNNNGIMDAKELLRVSHQNNFQVTESSAVRILTRPDKTVGFKLAKFCELLKDCPSTKREDLIYFLLELYDKVTCPHKDDLSDVLLENYWRTQNQIKAMSETAQRNTVLVEVEKMTGHTIEDLQGRDNTATLGSLTAIANMAALLIKESIKTSSDVETMEYSDLRNALIVEANKQFSIEVSILHSMTDRQLLKTFCTGCKVHVGKSTSNTISATVTEGCVCPPVVNKGNWLVDGTYSEEFKVTQDGSLLQVQRTDSDIGWSVDLSFMCKPGHVESTWTIIQRRGQFGNSADYFYKDFSDYENGFGSVDGELWLGLKNIAALTSVGEWELQVDLTDWGDAKYHAVYTGFSVGPSPTYRLNYAQFQDAKSTLGDSLAHNKGHAFSTRDRDQDKDTVNCAELFKGAWWYNRCSHSNLNGLYDVQQKAHVTGMRWYYGKTRGDGGKAWKASVIKIRRVDV